MLIVGDELEKRCCWWKSEWNRFLLAEYEKNKK